MAHGLYANPHARSAPANRLEAVARHLRPMDYCYVSLESRLSELGQKRGIHVATAGRARADLQKGVQVDARVVAEKAECYGLTPLGDALQTAVERLHDPGTHERFRQEMSRFLLSASARHLANDKFVTQFFDTAEQFLRGIESS